MTTAATTAITRDPEVRGGAPMFAGARAGVKILIDDLADGQRVEDFLRHYPSVTHDQAIAALDEVERLLEAST